MNSFNFKHRHEIDPLTDRRWHRDFLSSLLTRTHKHANFGPFVSLPLTARHTTVKVSTASRRIIIETPVAKCGFSKLCAFWRGWSFNRLQSRRRRCRKGHRSLTRLERNHHQSRKILKLENRSQTWLASLSSVVTVERGRKDLIEFSFRTGFALFWMAANWVLGEMRACTSQ